MSIAKEHTPQYSRKITSRNIIIATEVQEHTKGGMVTRTNQPIQPGSRYKTNK
jgi:hypothetical protein